LPANSIHQIWHGKLRVPIKPSLRARRFLYRITTAHPVSLYTRRRTRRPEMRYCHFHTCFAGVGTREYPISAGSKCYPAIARVALHVGIDCRIPNVIFHMRLTRKRTILQLAIHVACGNALRAGGPGLHGATHKTMLSFFYFLGSTCWFFRTMPRQIDGSRCKEHCPQSRPAERPPMQKVPDFRSSTGSARTTGRSLWGKCEAPLQSAPAVPSALPWSSGPQSS
jgi:hypothetical protein